MYTVTLSAGAVFSIGLGAGIILGIIALATVAIAANKKKK